LPKRLWRLGEQRLQLTFYMLEDGCIGRSIVVRIGECPADLIEHSLDVGCEHPEMGT
jgi:hypothetical protein